MRSHLLMTFLLLLGSSSYSQWTEHTIEGGDFKVKFPGAPEQKTQKISSTYGTLEMHMMIYSENDLSYTASFIDYPHSAMISANIDSFFNSARDGAINNTRANLTNEKIIHYDSYPGREIKLTLMEGKAILKMKYFLVKNRLYQLIVAAPPSKIYNQSVEQFFKSFHLEDQAGNTIIEKLLNNMNYAFDVSEEGVYHVTLKFENERTQLVRIAPFVSVLTNNENYDIWSPIAHYNHSIPDSTAHQMFLECADRPIGRFQSYPSNDGFLLVFSAIYYGDWEQNILKTIINEVADVSDIYEAELTHKDEY